MTDEDLVDIKAFAENVLINQLARNCYADRQALDPISWAWLQESGIYCLHPLEQQRLRVE